MDEGDRGFGDCGSGWDGGWMTFLGGICGIFVVELGKSWYCGGNHLWRPEVVGGGWNMGVASVISSGSLTASSEIMLSSVIVPFGCANGSRFNMEWIAWNANTHQLQHYLSIQWNPFATAMWPLQSFLELFPFLKKSSCNLFGWFAGDSMPFEAVIIVEWFVAAFADHHE